MGKTRQIFLILILAVCYFLAAKLGLALASVHPSATAVWPPTGIALAAVLLFGYRIWPAVFLGAFFANLTTEGNIITSLAIACGNTLEALLGGYLVHLFARGQKAFRRVSTIFKFIFLASLLATAVSATIGVTALAVSGFALWPDYWRIWSTWWLGDLAGSLLVAPLLMLWYQSPRFRWNAREALERAVFLVVLAAVGYLIFGNAMLGGTRYPLGFLVLPVLLWSMLRFNQRDAVSAAFILSVLALVWTVNGRGPFAFGSSGESLLVMQGFLSTVMLTTLVVSAEAAERKQRTRDAEALNAELRVVQKAMLNVLQDNNRQKTARKAESPSSDDILMNIGESLAVIDRRGKIIFANKVFQDAFNLSASECFGKNIEEVVEIYDNPSLLIQHAHPLFEVMRTGKKIKGLYYVSRGELTVHAQITAAPVMIDDKPAGAIGIIHTQ